MVTEGDHFSLTIVFLAKYLTDPKNFSSFENVILSSFRIHIFKFLKKSKISTLISLFSYFHQFKSQRQDRECDSAYQET